MPNMLRPIAATALAALALTAGAAAQQRETEQVDRTIPFQPGGTLRLKNFSGDIRITGSDSSDVTMHAVRRATRERLDRIRLTIETTGSVITINANDRQDDGERRNNVVETSFEIRVPRQTSLDVNAFSSPITVEDVQGRHNVQTFSGDLRLWKMAGPVRAKTFSGTIRLESTSTGDDLDLDTFSGDVELRLPPTAGADVHFNSFSGGIDSDLPLTLISQSRRNLLATLNGGGADVHVKTFSGDVRLAR